MANKKINQLVSKTSILSTDLFGIGDATTGQLFKKTIAELQAAIGGAVISVNGLVGTVVLDTDDIQELATPTNKYFTDARARAAISLTVTGNSGASTYSSGTGVLNVPTYTLAGLGGITASFLSGTSGISYNSTTGVISYSGTVYTDASIRALFSGSTGITYNSSTGAISYSGTVYTDSSVRALISLTTTGTSGASTYNNTTGVINVPNYTLAGLGGISLTSLSGGTGITYNSSTGAISYSGTVYTDSSIRALISATAPISYNNTTGVISITQSSTSANGFLSSTDWNTFNNKQSTITLTTTGTSGNATFSSNTLNIPNYGSALSGYLPLTGGTLTGALGGTSATFSGSVQTTNIGVGFAPQSAIGVFIYKNSSDENLVVQQDGSGIPFQVKSGGVTRLITTNAGNVGVGTTAPATLLHVNGSITVGTGGNLRLSSNSNEGELVAAFGKGIKFYTNDGNSNPLNLTSAGNVGIGTTSPGEQLVLQKDTYPTIKFIENTNSFSGFLQYHSASNEFRLSTITNRPLVFSTNDTDRGRVTGGGNWLLGTSSDNGERLYVSGAIRATGTITANSDISLKKNLLKIENALEKVEQINGYTYEFKADDSKRHAGVIAQEIQTVLPEIVNKGNDGILGVEYGNISALLIEATKEQQKQIKAQQIQINELKALLNK